MTEPKALATPLVYKKVIAVMTDMEALGKERKNVQQGYNFRGIDDVYNMIQPIMAKHGLVMSSTIMWDRTEERTSKNGGNLIYRILQIRYHLMAEDGSSISTDVIGEGMDSGDKAAPKAMSIAQKYALLQMFLIPTVEPKDPEIDSPETKPKGEAKDKPKAQPKDKPKDAPKDKPSLPEAGGDAFMKHDPAVPVTEEQATKIMDKVTAFGIVAGKSDVEMSEAIQKTIKKDYGIEIKGLKELDKDMADGLIVHLDKWLLLWKVKHPEPKS